MVMKRFIFVLLFYVLVNFIYYTESAPHHTKKFRKLTRGFKSFFCRLRHRKVIFNLDNEPVGCVRRCPSGYEGKYSLRWGHQCKPIVLPEGCADRFCIRCLSGYKWFYTFPAESRCITECPAGYLTRNGKMCDKCLIDGCAQCSSISTCTKCKGSRALHISGGNRVTCEEKCPKNYKRIKIQGIVICVVNVIITKAWTTLPPTTLPPTTTTTSVATTDALTTKEVLPKGCKDKDCTNCEEGLIKFFAANGGGQHCVNQCPPGYTNLSSICVGCSDRRCASCKSSMVECEKCFSNYIMQLDAANNTVECVLNCPKKHDLKVMNNVTFCIPKPEPECPVMNCKQCIRSNLQALHRGCAECKTGFKLFRGTFNDHCYATCPAGYYPAERLGTKTIICAKCQVPFCSRCINGGTCQECIGPMVLGSSGRCTLCPPTQSYNFDEKKCVENKFDEEKRKLKNNVVFEMVDESV